MIVMNKGYKGTDFGPSNRVIFTNVYGDEETFLDDYKNIGIPAELKDESIKTLFYLLYARYGDDYIASSNLARFKYDLFSRIFQYGPTWEKKLAIQKDVLTMSEEELLKGPHQIYNSAANPSIAPGTSTTDELKYIDNQNVTHHTRSKTEGYAIVLALLDDKITDVFLDKFKSLFKAIIEPDYNGVYYDVLGE